MRMGWEEGEPNKLPLWVFCCIFFGPGISTFLKGGTKWCLYIDINTEHSIISFCFYLSSPPSPRLSHFYKNYFLFLSSCSSPIKQSNHSLWKLFAVASAKIFSYLLIDFLLALRSEILVIIRKDDNKKNLFDFFLLSANSGINWKNCLVMRIGWEKGELVRLYTTLFLLLFAFGSGIIAAAWEGKGCIYTCKYPKIPLPFPFPFILLAFSPSLSILPAF